MIRCAWCGAKNYAIDMWCWRCDEHLDWRPAGPQRLRRAIGMLGALAATVGVALAVSMPAAAWFEGTLVINQPALSGKTIVPAAPARALQASSSPAALLEPIRKQDARQALMTAPRLQGHAAGPVVVDVNIDGLSIHLQLKNLTTKK